MLNALEEFLEPVEIVVIRGEAAAIAEWQQALASTYAPRRMALAIADGVPGLPAALAAKTSRGEAVAYVCRGPVCSAPLESLPELLAALSA